MEDVLVLQKQLVTRRLLVCLNPCCGGRCSSTLLNKTILLINHEVLILVVVEDVLVPVSLPDSVELTTRLNPCCGGRCSSTRKSCDDSGQLCVLILVVVEDVLVHKHVLQFN